MEKITGFNLSLNFGFTNNEEHKEVINRIENMIDELFNNEDIGAVLLDGKAEYIRKNNNYGINKI